MRVLKQSTARTVMVFMTDSVDHLTGKTGLTLTVTLSKNGAAFASISPNVTERGNGWYAIDLVSSNTDTLGDLAIRVTATGADPSDLLCQVVAYDMADAVSLGLSRLTTLPATQPNGLGGYQLTARSLLEFLSVVPTGGIGTVEEIYAQIGQVAEQLLTMLQQDGSVYRYTANALEQAPAGGGGGGGSITYVVQTASDERPLQRRTLREGNYGFRFYHIWCDALGNVVPIAEDANVSFLMWKEGETEATVDAAGEVRYGEGGVLGFLFTSDTPVPEAGRYNAVFRVENVDVPLGQSIPIIVTEALA
jgi:hypothetical protein